VAFEAAATRVAGRVADRALVAGAEAAARRPFRAAMEAAVMGAADTVAVVIGADIEPSKTRGSRATPDQWLTSADGPPHDYLHGFWQDRCEIAALK
jgi:hypothetical protein